MKQILQQAHNCNDKDDSLVLSKAVKIVKKIMINLKKHCYFSLLNNLSFPCHWMDPALRTCRITVLSLPYTCRRKQPKAATSHSKKIEPPIPLY